MPGTGDAETMLDKVAEDLIAVFRSNEEVPESKTRDQISDDGLPEERPILTGDALWSYYAEQLFARWSDVNALGRVVGEALVHSFATNPFANREALKLFGVYVPDFAGHNSYEWQNGSGEDLMRHQTVVLALCRALELDPGIVELARERRQLALKEEERAWVAANEDAPSSD